MKKLLLQLKKSKWLSYTEVIILNDFLSNKSKWFYLDLSKKWKSFYFNLRNQKDFTLT